MVKLKCIQCGKEYEVKDCRKESSHFCSHTCSNQWHHGSNHWRWNARGVKCSHCGVLLSLPNCRTKRVKHSFCSPECKKLWQRGKLHKPIEQRLRVERVCKICSKHFYVRPSVLKREGYGSYCSRKCAAEFHRRQFLEHNPDYTESFKEAMKQHWSDLEWAEKRIRETLQALLKRPTELERNLIDFFAKYQLPFKYTGDGSFLIGFKNPDFVDVNGLKICIEVHNSFFNRGDTQYAVKRKRHFARYGWDCIVLETKEKKLDCPFILNTLGKELVDRGVLVGGPL